MQTASCSVTLPGRNAYAFKASSAVRSLRKRSIPHCLASRQPAGDQKGATQEFKLNSTAIPVFTLAAAEGLRQALLPQAEYFKTLNLPEPLVHWGHPGNMLVVLLAMGGYGAVYLGWQIRLSNDEATIIKAKDMHPKLSLGMTIFFALGAVGGMLSLVMQDKPIFESTHVWTGLLGLTLLGIQAMLPLFFLDDRGTRDIHAYLGTGIFALFLVHAYLGLQLGLSI